MDGVIHDFFLGIIIFAFLAVFMVIIFGRAHGSDSAFTQVLNLFGTWFNDSRLML